MVLTLTTELEQYVHDRVQQGDYSSPDDVISQALDLLRKRDDLRKEIEIGIDQMNRGELMDFDADEIIREGKRRKENSRGK